MEKEFNPYEKEFNPYEQALELKEIGFDEPCFGNWQDMKEETPWFSKSYADNQNQYYGQLCSAPTFSQAFRFFREKHGLKSWIEEHTENSYIYEIRPHKLADYKEGEIYVYVTYEEAELACLKKLIEIVKKIK